MDREKELEQPIECNTSNERLKNMLKMLSKCKVDFITDKEECSKLKEVNLKLELELKEARELEKAHRHHLQSSREMIGNLQDTVSHLVYLKRDMKKLKDDIISKDITIGSMAKEKENAQQNYNSSIAELRKKHERHIEELISINEKKVQQAEYDYDTKIAQFTCAIEELRSKLQDTEKEYKDKINIVVLEYEEKIQKSAVEITHLQGQLKMQADRTDANMNAYRKKLEDLEGKLKQTQFKEHLAQSIYTRTSQSSQFQNQVERPYSVQSNYTDITALNSPACPSPKPTPNPTPNMYANNNFKTPRLQVMYHDTKPQNLPRSDKKGNFSITKKRKLYTEKDFL